jgi:hypothetical protein
LAGDSELSQLEKIFDVFGTPGDNWTDAKLLPSFVSFKPQPSRPLKTIFTAATADVIGFLESMLQLDPCKRCTATEVIVFKF